MKRSHLGAASILGAFLAAGVWTTAASAGPPTWTGQFGTNRFEGVGGVAVTPGGTIFVAGTTAGRFPGRHNAGQADAFLARYRASGAKQWVKEFGTKGKEHVSAVALSPGGDVYIAGYTDGTFPKATQAGGFDGFLAKYSSGGTQKWVRQFGTTGDDLPRGVAVSPSGDVYVTGSTDGAFPTFANAGDDDGFLLKFSSGGTQKWVVQLGTSEVDALAAVAVSPTGDVVVAGDTKGDFPTYVNEGDVDAVVAEFNAAGAEQWLTQFGTTSFDHALGVAFSKTGELFVGGYTGGSFPTFVNAGSADAFVMRFDPATGSELWTQQFGTDAEDDVAGIAVSKSGFVVVGGSTYGAFPTFANTGGADAFGAVLDDTGAPLGLAQFGTGADETVSGVASTSAGNPVLAGGTHGAFPGFVNAGNADAFVMHLDAGLPESI